MLGCIAMLGDEVPSIVQDAMAIVAAYRTGRADESAVVARQLDLGRYLLAERGKMPPGHEGAVRLAISALRSEGREEDPFFELHWAVSACLAMGLEPDRLIALLERTYRGNR
jgi:hypothetical protein